MNQVEILRMLRWPLIAGLGLNVAIVVVAPISAKLPGEPAVRIEPGSTDVLAVKSNAHTLVESAMGDAEANPKNTEPSHPQIEVEIIDEGTTARDASTVNVGTDNSLADQVFTNTGESLGLVTDRVDRVPWHRPLASAAKRIAMWQSQAAQNQPEPATERPPSIVDSTANAQAVPDTSTNEEKEANVIQITNASEYPVSFLFETQAFTLQPKETLSKDADHAVVRFHKGQSFGEGRENVTNGSYDFTVTSQGWQLQRTGAERRTQ